MAIGNTLGSPFKGKLREEILLKFKDFNDFLSKNRNLFKTYTDDTQLTLHLTEALIQGNGFRIDNTIKEFILWLYDPPISPSYERLTTIRKLERGIEYRNASTKSKGNGSISRVAPIGLFYSNNIELLKKTAELSSMITHSDPTAIAGSILIARAISYLIKLQDNNIFPINDFFNILIPSISNIDENTQGEYIGALEKLRENLDLSANAGLIKFSQIGVKSPFFIEEYLGKAFIHPYSVSTIICVIFIFLNNLDSFEQSIISFITAGGDTDTVGTIGGGLAGAYFGYKNISTDLIKLVKNRKYILDLSERFYKTYLSQFRKLI
ncbi:MAG: ADP-ribosylglycohydrolase family protein [Candidatus Lokiarchaeota archaeon]|nr:ADP-ribosylglycohydrolase family protein [Candidatus Lokiarchaeota archaeon]